MKVGDIVRSTKVRPAENATVIKADVIVKNRADKKSDIRSKYVAQYPDGAVIEFYGFNIGQTIFKQVVPDGQMSLFDM